MAKIIVRTRVAYPARLLKTLEPQTATRAKSGERHASYCALADDPHVAYGIFDWESVESAKPFGASQQGKAQIAEWHSVDSPEILILEEANM